MNEELKPLGRKDDQQKLQWSLLPFVAVRAIIEVLVFGADKYAPDNWKHVENPRQRYFDATMRHLTTWYGGEKLDPESGKSHLAHAGCCVLFLLWFEAQPLWFESKQSDSKGWRCSNCGSLSWVEKFNESLRCRDCGTVTKEKTNDI